MHCGDLAIPGTLCFVVRRIQRYLLHQEIASGGMGAIYLAKLPSEGGFSKVVAVKVMHAQYARNADFRAMFLDEARIVAGIRHPNVVSTLDILEEGGELFLVMDYVHGPSLSSVLADLRDTEDLLAQEISAAIMVDVLEGLGAAHEARSDRGAALGIVHRDISPQNILLSSDGTARVVDFGIALAADRLHLTTPGEVKGKASYMPPEQAQGHAVDRRADIYAVGVTMFELCTGRRPFLGKMTEVMLKQITEAPPRPSALHSRVTPDLERVILKAMAKDPEARYDSARAMADAIRGAIVLPQRRVVADWLSLHQKRFFERRDAQLFELQAIDTGPGQSLIAAALAFPDDATIPDGALRMSPRRWPYALVLAGIVLGGTGAGIAYKRQNVHEDDVEGATRSHPATVLLDAGEALTPAVVNPPADASAAIVPSVDATVSAAPRLVVVDRRRAPPTVVTQETTKVQRKPLEPCCVHGLRKAFSNCSEEGCPP